METRIFTQKNRQAYLIVSLLYILYICPFNIISAQYSVDWQWHNAYGANGAEFGEKVIMDTDGNFYVSAQFEGTIDVDPGTATVNLVSSGGLDCAIICYDGDGNYVWAKRIGGTGEDRIWEIEWKQDHLYIAGSFSNTVDFDPGTGITNLTSAGNLDIFIAKFEDDGDFVWVKKMGDTERDEGWGIGIDSNDDIIIGCGFKGTVDFDPGPGSADLISAGDYDFVIAKYSNAGDLIWAESMGGSGYDFFYSLDLDANDNIFVGGMFQNTVDFDPSAGIEDLSSNGGWDFVVASYDTDGNYRWASAGGGTGEDRIYSVVVSSSGNVYCGGWFNGTNIEFNPGVGTQLLSSNGGNDAFIMKLENDGDVVWAKSWGGTGFDGSFCLYVDSDELVYTVGQFTGTNVDFDPDVAGSYTLTSSSTDIFMSLLDENGDFVWARNPSGTSAVDNFRGIVVDESTNEIYVTGHFGTTVDFDVEAGTENATAVGNYDFALVKYTYELQNPLPVVLVSFNAVYSSDNKVVELDWITSSEINCDYYSIQMSVDMLSWNEVSLQYGKGNTNQTSFYHAVDKNPHTGVSYYRLVQYDYDGAYTIFDPKSVVVSDSQAGAGVVVYPNPVSDILMATRVENYSMMELVDPGGKVLLQSYIVENAASMNVQSLKSGIYFLRLTGMGTDQVVKVVINH